MRGTSRVINFVCYYTGVFNNFFLNLDLGLKWLLRCKPMELESLRCIVVVVRPTYVLFS